MCPGGARASRDRGPPGEQPRAGPYDAEMRLRLYHHADGARVAYREIGAGPPLALFHSALLSHKEWEPAVEHLADRFRVVLPDLPLHGDSEDRPRHPYTLDWFAEVLGGFAAEVLGPRPRMAGHGAGATILLHAVVTRRVRPARLVLMGNGLHAPPAHPLWRTGWRLVTSAAAVPGLDGMLSYAPRLVFTPEWGLRLSARGNPAAADLVRHAFADVPGNCQPRPIVGQVRARMAARGADPPARPLSAAGHAGSAAVGRQGPAAPAPAAEEALRLLPNGQLRVLQSTGFLLAYDDPVGLARELVAFCG